MKRPELPRENGTTCHNFPCNLAQHAKSIMSYNGGSVGMLDPAPLTNTVSITTTSATLETEPQIFRAASLESAIQRSERSRICNLHNAPCLEVFSIYMRGCIVHDICIQYTLYVYV